MTSTILNTSFMLRAIQIAKGLVFAREERELSSAAMLGGIVLAVRYDNHMALKPNLSTEQILAARDTLENCGFSLPDDLPKQISTNLPLDAVLKSVIKQAGDDLEIFIDLLIKAVLPRPINKLVQMTQYYLSAYVEDHGTIINAAMFAAAAFSAFEAGEFTDRPGITSYFATNRIYFDALLLQKYRGLRSRKSTPPAVFDLLPELKNALNQNENEGAVFIAAVNLGLAIGLQIINARAVAYHEAGHAVVHYVLRPQISVSKVTIVKTNNYNGAFLPDVGSPHWQRFSRNDFLHELCVLMAGRCAELIKFGFSELDSGAQSDLETATKQAWDHIANLGLDPEFGPVSIMALRTASAGEAAWISEQAQRRLQHVLRDVEAKTTAVLKENWVKVEALAHALIANGEVDLEQFMLALSVSGLQNLAGTVIAEPLPLERNVEIATSPGSLETLEGTVRYSAGDAILTGEQGERWPVDKRAFDRLYEHVVVEPGSPTVKYRKRLGTVLALQLAEQSRVDLSGGRGTLFGSSGDWIVDYGNGDMSVVSGEVFANTYRIIN